MILNDTVSTKQYNTINVMIVNFPFLDGDFPRRPYYGDYISQPIRFARASSYHDSDFNSRNKFLNAELLQKGYRYHTLPKAFFRI